MKTLYLVMILLMISAMLIGCSKTADIERGEPSTDSIKEAPEDVSAYDVDLVAEDEVDVGEVV